MNVKSQSLCNDFTLVYFLFVFFHPHFLTLNDNYTNQHHQHNDFNSFKFQVVLKHEYKSYLEHR